MAINTIPHISPLFWEITATSYSQKNNVSLAQRSILGELRNCQWDLSCRWSPCGSRSSSLQSREIHISELKSCRKPTSLPPPVSHVFFENQHKRNMNAGFKLFLHSDRSKNSLVIFKKYNTSQFNTSGTNRRSFKWSPLNLTIIKPMENTNQNVRTPCPGSEGGMQQW